jgi:hypothetical protein
MIILFFYRGDFFRREIFKVFDPCDNSGCADGAAAYFEKQFVPSLNFAEGAALCFHKPRFDGFFAGQNRIQIRLFQDYKMVLGHFA